MIFYFLLVSSIGVFGRELECGYFTITNALRPTYNYCELSLVDLSEDYKNSDFSFTGTPEQKSAATTVFFHRPYKVDFLPKEILNDFPQFNSLSIHYCDTLTVLKNDLFSKDFNAIEYLHLGFNKIESIEANAFQHLRKLKWIDLGENQMQSLPHQIFRNLPEIIAIWLNHNKINSITPDFFKNLYELQFVNLIKNQCTQNYFGCYSGSCSVSQSELNTDLSTCYTNCENDVECASKSGKLENLSPDDIEQNIDLIVSSGHASTLIKRYHTSLEKVNEDNIEKDSKLKICDEAIQKLKKESAESDANLHRAISGWTLSKQSNAECNREKEAIDQELRALKLEIADLKIKLLDSDRHLDCRVKD